MWFESGPVYLRVGFRSGCGLALAVMSCSLVDVGYWLLDVLLLLLVSVGLGQLLPCAAGGGLPLSILRWIVFVVWEGRLAA